jgi:hypothetical protein
MTASFKDIHSSTLDKLHEESKNNITNINLRIISPVKYILDKTKKVQIIGLSCSLCNKN